MNDSKGSSSPVAPVHLKRALKLWDLIIIGIVIIQPIAPMGIYGVINNNAGGHVVTTILIAMVAMLFTAISYGKMARAYPSLALPTLTLERKFIRRSGTSLGGRW